MVKGVSLKNKDSNFISQLVVFIVVLSILVVVVFLADFLFGLGFIGITGNAISDVASGAVDFISDLVGINSISSNTGVSRSFNPNQYIPGQSVNVGLRVNINSADSILNYGIEELLPVGWTVESVVGATSWNQSGRMLKIIVYSSGETNQVSKDINYTIIATDVGTASFIGNVTFTDNTGVTSQELKIISGLGSLNENTNVNNPPIVSMISPLDGTIYPDPYSTVGLSANATDDGGVASVEFYNQSGSIGSASISAGIIYFLNVNMAPGSYIIRARATDNEGASTDSSAVNIRVNSAPLVSVSVYPNSPYIFPVNLTLNASVIDDVTISGSVVFYDGDSVLGTSSLNGGFASYRWDNVPKGNHIVKASVVDSDGIAVNSSDISLNILDETCTDKDDDGMAENAIDCSGGNDFCYESDNNLISKWDNQLRPISGGYGVNYTINNASQGLRNVSDLYVNISGLGSIKFSGNTRLVGVNSTGCFVPLNVSKYISILNNNISVDSSYNSGYVYFNRAGRLTFENVVFDNPRILLNGVLCSNCNKISNDKGAKVAVFDVSGFSSYTLEETPVVPDDGDDGGGGGGGGGGSGSRPPVVTNSTQNATTQNQTMNQSVGQTPGQPENNQSEIPQTIDKDGKSILIPILIIVGLFLLMSGIVIALVYSKKNKKEKVSLTSNNLVYNNKT